MQQRRLTGRAARASNLAVADALSALTVGGAIAGVREGWQPLPLPALRPPPAAGINPSVARSPSLRILTEEKRGAGLHPLPLPALCPPPAVLDIPFAARSPRVLGLWTAKSRSVTPRACAKTSASGTRPSAVEAKARCLRASSFVKGTGSKARLNASARCASAFVTVRAGLTAPFARPRR